MSSTKHPDQLILEKLGDEWHALPRWKRWMLTPFAVFTSDIFLLLSWSWLPLRLRGRTDKNHQSSDPQSS